MKQIISAILVSVILQSVSIVGPYARERVDSSGNVISTYSGSLAATYDVDAFIDANRIFSYVTNLGSFGRDNVGRLNLNGGGGMVFPYAGMANIANGQANKTGVFVAGIWLGGIDHATGDTLVTRAEYNDEYVPGPMKNGSFQSDDPAFRVYKLHRDSLIHNPNPDYLNWPVSQGAPVDHVNRPAIRGLQTLWTVFNDANPAAHTNDAGRSAPVGVEVQQTFWSIGSPSGLETNTLYLTYKLINKGQKFLNDFFVCLWFDPDLGGFTDDLVGSDPADDLFYCYNATNNDGVYGSNPPAFAVKLVEGPTVASPGNSAFVNGVQVPDLENLRMYSINKYINGTDPESPAEAYKYMVGLDGKTGHPLIDPTNGQPTRFFGSGDPVTGTGFLDSDPSDRRMMGSVGPLTFNPGDTQYVTWVMAFGQGIDRLTSITQVRHFLRREIDSDGDGVAYYVDNCPEVYNPDQRDDDNDGVGNACLQTDVVITTEPTLPGSFALHQNYPNPFNPSTKIRLDLPYRSEWKITIYNVNGQTVEALSGESSAGTVVVDWNASAYATGIYFVKAQVGEFSSIRKMMLLK